MDVKLKVVGSSIWVMGDSDPFWVVEHPDVAVDKIENSLRAGEKFTVLTGHHYTCDDNTGERTETAKRSFYIRPELVTAVSLRLVEDDD
jgi:hypothetical protein